MARKVDARAHPLSAILCWHFETSTPAPNTLLVAMSLFAQPDRNWCLHLVPGSLHTDRIGRKAEKRGKLKETISYWLKVGVLREVSPGRPKHAAEYCINVNKMAHFISKDLGTTVEQSPRANPIPNSDYIRQHQVAAVNLVPDRSQLGLPESSQLGTQSPKYGTYVGTTKY